MDIIILLLYSLFTAFVGYGVGCIFLNNKMDIKYDPRLWALLGFFLGFEGLIFGVIYGLLKMVYYNNRKR